MSARLAIVCAFSFAFGLHSLCAAARHDDAGVVECHSENYQYNECQTPFRSAELIEQLSGSACIENKSWGFNPQTGFVWVSAGCAARFGEGTYVERGVYEDRSGSHHRRYDRGEDSAECSSQGYRFTRCGIPWRGARLVEQLSDSECIENQSWGVDGEGLWVDQGCSARFVEARAYDDRRAPSGYDYDPAHGGGATLICESRGGDRDRCPLPRGVAEVHIDEQLSQTPCRRGENWDYDDRELWVKDGCRARFRYWMR